MITRFKNAASRFVESVRTDYEAVLAYRAKYNADSKNWSAYPGDVVRKVGVQMMLGVRVMHLLRDSGLPLAPQVASRLMRHLYACDIHWDAELAPGVSIIHGQGLVVSGEAKVGAGCIVFQGVTIGEGRSPDTEMVGSPIIEENVHIGPNAVILGPIRVGAGTKIAAGAVLTRSVPPSSLVSAGEPVITTRTKRKTNAARETGGRGEQV
jgi:serine acetyltransferase